MGIKLINLHKKIKEDKLPLVIGYFGCIHVMHQQLLTKYNDFNVLTFTDLVSKRPHQIYNYKARLDNLQQFKPRNIYVLDVSSINMSAKKFINSFLIPLNPSVILVGEDFKFGSDNKGVKFLKDYFRVMELGYNPDISTKKIHDLITRGKVDEANDYMSSYLHFIGKWISGLKEARKLGYPTINLQNERPFMLPQGSYVTQTTIGNKKYKSVSFVGQSKTIKHNEPIIETHIYDQKIKAKYLFPYWIKNNIKVEFYKFIRPNTKLVSKDKLKEAIAKDILVAKKYFKDMGI